MLLGGEKGEQLTRVCACCRALPVDVCADVRGRGDGSLSRCRKEEEAFDA